VEARRSRPICPQCWPQARPSCARSDPSPSIPPQDHRTEPRRCPNWRESPIIHLSFYGAGEDLVFLQRQAVCNAESLQFGVLLLHDCEEVVRLARLLPADLLEASLFELFAKLFSVLHNTPRVPKSGWDRSMPSLRSPSRRERTSLLMRALLSPPGAVLPSFVMHSSCGTRVSTAA
jgi:hypothetical protein